MSTCPLIILDSFRRTRFANFLLIIIDFHSLRRLLHGTVSLKVSHELLHPGKRIWERAITQSCNGLFDPLQQVCDHPVILLLHSFNVHHDAYDLRTQNDNNIVVTEICNANCHSCEDQCYSHD